MRNDRFYQMRYDDPRDRLIWEPMLRNTTTLYPIARRDPIFFPTFSAILMSGTTFSAGAINVLAGAASFLASTTLTHGIQENAAR